MTCLLPRVIARWVHLRAVEAPPPALLRDIEHLLEQLLAELKALELPQKTPSSESPGPSS